MIHLVHTEADYIVNIQNPSSRTFTVAFQSKQANATEHVIVVADDDIVEGAEAFRLQLLLFASLGKQQFFSGLRVD